MHPHLLRLPLGAPRVPAVLKVPDEFLLLGVHREHGGARRQIALRRLVDVGELGVTVGVVVAFARLAVALQAVAPGVQHPRHPRMADRMPLGAQLGRQLAHALAGPAQGRLRVPPRRRLDQPLQVRPHARIFLDRRLAPASRPADTPRCGDGARPAEFLDPHLDDFARQTRGARHGRNPAPADGQGLRRRHGAPPPFVQCPCHARVALFDPLLSLHPSSLRDVDALDYFVSVRSLRARQDV